MNSGCSCGADKCLQVQEPEEGRDEVLRAGNMPEGKGWGKREHGREREREPDRGTERGRMSREQREGGKEAGETEPEERVTAGFPHLGTVTSGVHPFLGVGASTPASTP